MEIIKQEIKEKSEKSLNFFKQRKVQNIVIIILFLTILIGTSAIRLQNLPLLVDSTTGKNIPLALDPFYWLRISETIAETGLPEFDLMRYPSLQVGFSPEILPNVVVFLHKIVSNFNNEITLQYLFVISPVIFFILGLITFFFLIFVLTNSKWIALISSFFLAIIPTYLYRTMAGFADHESIGMFAFFLCLLSYSLAIKYLDKKILKTICLGLLVGFTSALTIACWGGISNFVFMIIPLSFLFFWIMKVDSDEKILFNYLLFYSIWFISSILFSLGFGFDINFVLGKVALSFSSLMNSGIFLFLIIDFCIIKFGKKILNNEIIKKYRVLISFLITLVFSIIFLSVYGTNILSLIPNLFKTLLNPSGLSRTGLTVAENASPYLTDWINQVGKLFFWMFYIGMAFVGIEISKGFLKKKNKVLFSFTWIIMISGILFSRISAISLLNGNNFISHFIYFGGLLIFLVYCVSLYFNDDIKVKKELLIIASLLIFILIGGRGAIRFLFVVTPIICFMIGYCVVKLFEYVKKSKDISKLLLSVSLIFMVIGLMFFSFNFINSINQQAKYTGPSANYQWQNAMSWVRDNTPENSVVTAWWDYGYFIQYLGERATVTDGGHAVSYWDHLIGRYLLTTPNPNTALSFMKTQNVSYLLIDPTDLGKYPAYSRIGSDDSGLDRFSGIPVMPSDPKQIVETKNSTTFVYVGGTYIYEDIIYNEQGREIFLPSEKTSIIGIILEINNNMLAQPIGVFLYNEQQFNIPLKYIYINNEILNFNKGLDSVVSIIPRVNQINQEISIDSLGIAIYLSPKVSKSLFAQLYLLDDVFGNYNSVKLVHSEQDMSVIELNNQGANVGGLIYFNGFRGPIKIWEVNYPENILVKEEFLKKTGEYASLDNLTFVK